MDIFRQTNKGLRKKYDENDVNTRRVAENFPMLEAKVDEVAFDKAYSMEFYTSPHPHTIRLNILFKPPVNCFRCETGNPVNLTESIAGAPTFGPEDGNQHLVTFGGFSSNVGGFLLGTTSSIIVPTTGVYNFRFVGNVSGVTIDPAAAFIVSIRLGEATVLQRSWSIARGTLGGPLAFINVDINLIALCMTAAAGDSISLWLGAGGIAFYGPIGSVTTTLIALA